MQNILIMGAGISGLGAARVLSDQGCHVVLSDLHEIQDEKKRSTLESRGVRFSIGPQTTGLLDGIDTMVVSPVIPRENLLVQEAFSRHIPVISEIELAYRVAKARILAVTGTNGKTTTTSLLGKFWKRKVSLLLLPVILAVRSAGWQRLFRRMDSLRQKFPAFSLNLWIRLNQLLRSF